VKRVLFTQFEKEILGLVRYFSAPGRVEVCGNHTDHQRGRVLAAAISMDVRASVIPNDRNFVYLSNDQFSAGEIDLSDLSICEDEKGTSASLVRGIAAWFSKREYPIGGFDAEISSDVPVGAGVSSSAAFSVLIGNIFKGLYGANISAMEIARAGQYAENEYFGKPCGLMDQAASSFGGLNVFDFKDPINPSVTHVHANLPGYCMCVVDTGGSHEDLTADYAAVTLDMKTIANYFGKDFLREVDDGEFFNRISELRHLGERAVLRAIHFFDENRRVLRQAKALESGDIQTFLDLVIESGRSSLSFLQNVFSITNPQEQGVTLALALSERILAGRGAWRVHGGGFAGTILAFVPDGLKELYHSQMSIVFGADRIHFLTIQEHGGREYSYGRT